MGQVSSLTTSSATHVHYIFLLWHLQAHGSHSCKRTALILRVILNARRGTVPPHLPSCTVLHFREKQLFSRSHHVTLTRPRHTTNPKPITGKRRETTARDWFRTIVCTLGSIFEYLSLSRKLLKIPVPRTTFRHFDLIGQGRGTRHGYF